jgi:hypothetical protein
MPASIFEQKIDNHSHVSTNMNLFLSVEELAELTGYQRQKNIIEWLTRYGYPILGIAADGYPRVLREVLQVRGLSDVSPKRPSPNLVALKKAS